MFADKTSNERTSRAGAAATHENVLKCLQETVVKRWPRVFRFYRRFSGENRRRRRRRITRVCRRLHKNMKRYRRKIQKKKINDYWRNDNRSYYVCMIFVIIAAAAFVRRRTTGVRVCGSVLPSAGRLVSGEVERASDDDWSGVVPDGGGGGGGGGGGAAGGLVLHCCCCGAGQDDGRRDTHTPGTRMGPRLFRQPTNTTGGSSGGRNVNTTAAAER